MVSMTQPTAAAAARAAEANNSKPATTGGSGFVAQNAQSAAGGKAPGGANADPTKPSAHKVIANAPFQINPLGNRQQYLKMLVYGKHGCGKTTLGATSVDCEPMRDVIFIDAEQGDAAVQDNPRITNYELISHVRVTSFKQVAYIHQFLTAHCIARDANDLPRLRELESRITGIPPQDIERPRMFRTALVDSLTEIDQYCLYALRGVNQEQLLDDPGDIDQVEWKGYGKNNEMVKMLVRAYRDLPMHVIFSCSDQYTQNEVKKFHYTPAMTGKLSTQVQGMVDIVGFLCVSAQENEDGELPRRMFIQPGEVGNARFDAKNRRAIYKGTFWDNPVMSQIMKDTGMVK
jgi:hypothetical protein